MKPADEREEVLFREALRKASGPERKGFLDGVCRGEDTLRARLNALLRAQEKPDRDILFRDYKPSIRAVASITLEKDSSGKGAIRWTILAWSTPAMPSTFTTDSWRSHLGLAKVTSHPPPRISVVRGTTTAMLRSRSGWRADTTTHGLALATIPKSTNTTSPRSNLVIIDLWRWPELFPGVRHQSLHQACWSLHLGRGHHPPAACFSHHEVLPPLLGSAEGDAAFFIGLDQNRLPVHARNLALSRLPCQAQK